MLKVTTSGGFTKTEAFLKDASKPKYTNILHKYGQRGVDLLKSATPVDTGLTAAQWRYKIELTKRGVSLQWLNDSVTDDGGIPVVVLLVYGHGAQNGTYVQGNNFVNPVMVPLLNSLSEELMREVN